MILTCCVGYIMGMREQFPGSWLNFVLNAFLIKSSYVGSFWFVQTYTILVLLSGVFFKLIKKYSYWIVLPISLILYAGAFGIEYIVLERIQIEAVALLVNALMLFMRSQFSFVIGMIMAKEEIVDRWRLLSKIRNNPVLPWLLLILVIVVRANLRHMIFCSVFRSCFDCVIWHIQLGRSRREDIIVLRKTFYEYVADSYAVLYDICANTCIRIKECVCNHVDISIVFTCGILCSRLDI